ncbi:cst complex subunit stn1 [Quercus suber]|uniref:CST complex subunit STN1 n=1 Tax=Quercus suber TaxID=58331 RepID=A0AAW0I523_QUESU
MACNHHHQLYNTQLKLLAFDLLSLTQTPSHSPSDPISFSRKGIFFFFRVETIGTITSRELKPNKFLKFTIDDGTNCIFCVLWLNHLVSPYFSPYSPPSVRLIVQMASHFAVEVRLGVVARVRERTTSYLGRITSYRGAV